MVESLLEVGCNFVAFTREGELQSFYSVILIPSLFCRLFNDGHSDQCEMVLVIFFFFWSLGLHLRHKDVLKLGVESKL